MHSPYLTPTSRYRKQHQGSNESPASNYSSVAVVCISMGYIFAMGVCGFIVVALGSTLSSLAANVGYSAYDIGTVFVARGAGCILGTVASSILYKHYNGNILITTTVVATVFILGWLPYCVSWYMLHFAYFALGFITAVTETGSQLMMVKFHGEDAGPWVGANSMAFCVSGIIVPGVQLITTDIRDEFLCYALCVAFSGVWLLICPDPEQNGRISPRQSTDDDDMTEHYWVEATISLMIFLMIGGGESIMFYIKVYVMDTDVIDDSYATWLFLIFFVFVTVGKILGIVDQSYLTNDTIVPHFLVLLIGSALPLAGIWAFPDSSWFLWVGISLFGACQGPAISYCFDLCNRFTYPSELSMSILMLGLNLGVSIVPYFSSLLWALYLGPIAIIVVGVVTMGLCVPLLLLCRRLSYITAINNYTRIEDGGSTIQMMNA